MCPTVDTYQKSMTSSRILRGFAPVRIQKAKKYLIDVSRVLIYLCGTQTYACAAWC